MRLVVQRVKNCSVTINNEIKSVINSGLLVYVGIEREDNQNDLDYSQKKLLGLRIFQDNNGKMNLSVKDTDKEIMVISQFTIMGDTKKGNRPSFNKAEDPAKAKILYNKFVSDLKFSGLNIETGMFQEHMEISYINDGPVTILIDSRKVF